MKDNLEKRKDERECASIPIVCSYFNKEEYFQAQTLNHCPGGVCLKSETYLKPGAAVLFRVHRFDRNAPCDCNSIGLRTVSLAEVKWCREILDSKAPSYEVGIKYFAPTY